MNVQVDDEQLVEKAVALSVVEIVLGSLLHTFRIPFSGQFLSLNQGFFLTKSILNINSRQLSAKSSFEISMIVAVMKSLSPAGKKFGPMISIGMQGSLYSLGILLFGNNILGQVVAMILLSFWAFLQPFMSYFIIYGTDIIKAFEYFITKLNRHTPVTIDTVWSVVITILSIKIFLAILIPLLLRYMSHSTLDKYDNLLNRLDRFPQKKSQSTSALKGALSDLFKPFFVLSMVMMISFFLFSEPSHVQAIWKGLRVIAIAFIFFYVTRSQKVYEVLMHLSGKNKKVARIFELSRIAYKKLMKN